MTGAVAKAANCGSTDCGEGGLVDPGFYILGAAIGAGAGALVDLSIKRFDTVFASSPTASGRRLRLALALFKDAKSFRVSLAF